MVIRSQLLAGLVAALLLIPLVPARAAGDAVQGKQIAQSWCASCHAIGREAQASDKAPAWVALAADPDKSETYLKGWITNPHPPMPNFNLSRQMVDDLVAYIRSLGEGKKAIQKR